MRRLCCHSQLSAASTGTRSFTTVRRMKCESNHQPVSLSSFSSPRAAARCSRACCCLPSLRVSCAPAKVWCRHTCTLALTYRHGDLVPQHEHVRRPTHPAQGHADGDDGPVER
eukprot:scaffold37620_cov64-Phaeocystis_antarctica.AAC.5